MERKEKRERGLAGIVAGETAISEIDGEAGTLRYRGLAIEDVAAQLGMSARSLQRHLELSRTSYQRLLAETRESLARRYMAESTLTLTEMALLLGYADLSAFSRAFRRWTGKSPRAVRRRRAGGATARRTAPGR